MDDLTPLLHAFERGEPGVLCGAILLVVVSLVRVHLDARLEKGAAKDWISAVSSVLGALGVALVAGGLWWHAVLLSLLAAPASSGLWRLVFGLFPGVKHDA